MAAECDPFTRFFSTLLVRQYEAIARTIQDGRVVKGRWACRLTSQEARDLRSWCIHQADRVRALEVDTAAVLEGAATDVSAAMVQPVRSALIRKDSIAGLGPRLADAAPTRRTAGLHVAVPRASRRFAEKAGHHGAR
jgi:hypothetical protein